ncbi:MAG: hypothetical protein RLZZ77_2483 [Bacteroidota bacterium]|jgi:hypothetical protein
MKNHLKKAFALFAIVGSFALVSCEQDEFEDVVTDPNPVNTDTINNPVDTTDTVSPGECSGSFTIAGPSGNPADTAAVNYVNYAQGSAAIFEPFCGTVITQADSSQYYCVIYSNSQQWGANGVLPGWSINGFQGIEIISGTPFQVGGTYELAGDYLGYTSYVTVPTMGMIQVYQIENGSVTLAEAGDEVGENIAGTFTASMITLDGIQVTVSGTFCVPVESVCN